MLDAELCTTLHFAGKEDVMPQQVRRDVLFMDVHGVFLSAEDPNEPGSPLVGYRRHQKWVDVIRLALGEAGALQHQINEAFLDPRVLWQLRMHIELTIPRIRKGRGSSERRFHERVNLRLLRKVAPSFIRSIVRGARKRIARRVKELRQDASRHGYILESEMRELVHWLAEEDQRWLLCLTTAGDPDHTAERLRAQNAPLSLFIRNFTTEKVGLPKSHPDFWTKIAAQASASADKCVVVEDNLAMGVNAIRAGMSVIFLDRGYGIEDFITKELKGEVAGVHLSRVGESLPMYGQQFMVCAKTLAGIKLCLQRIKTTSVGEA